MSSRRRYGSSEPWSRREFPVARTIEVKGGIKARSRRGAFASRWWAQRWLSVLDSLNLGGRLDRARTYARKGQVVEIDIQPGRVKALVQGSRPKPYDVEIGMTKLNAAQQKRLGAELAKNTYCLAKLLTREMPPDIESIFTAAGVPLFPARASELQTSCSCPDWSNPCKHIAAVYYLLGEEFDRDPFLVFTLRGVDVSSVIAAPQDVVDEGSPVEATPLIADHFWEADAAVLDFAVDEKQTPAPLLRVLGNLPFWRGERPLADSLEETYTRAAANALALLSR